MENNEEAPLSILERMPAGPAVRGYARAAMLMGYFEVAIDGSFETLLRKVCSALKDDPRIERLVVPEVSEEFSDDPWYWPHDDYTSKQLIISGDDGFNNFVFSDAISFDVSMPTESSDYEDEDTVYAPKIYSVLWNGMFALVSWPPDDHKDYPRKAGQQIATVLEEVMGRIGGRIYSQACSPHCDFVFMHKTLEIVEGGDDDVEISVGDGIDVLRTFAGSGGDLSEYAWNVFYELNLKVGEFASVKNVGQRILDIESSVRTDLDTLLGVLYGLSLQIRSSVFQRIKLLKKSRSQRKEVSPLVAGLWLQVVRMEALRARWSGEAYEFESAIEKSTIRLLFAGEYEKDFSSIRNIDLVLIREAIAEAAERLDNRAVIVATVMAALSGGVAGALVAAILH